MGMLETSHQQIVVSAIERMVIQADIVMTCMQIPRTSFTYIAIYADEIAKGCYTGQRK